MDNLEKLGALLDLAGSEIDLRTASDVLKEGASVVLELVKDCDEYEVIAYIKRVNRIEKAKEPEKIEENPKRKYKKRERITHKSAKERIVRELLKGRSSGKELHSTTGLVWHKYKKALKALIREGRVKYKKKGNFKWYELVGETVDDKKEEEYPYRLNEKGVKDFIHGEVLDGLKLVKEADLFSPRDEYIFREYSEALKSSIVFRFPTPSDPSFHDRVLERVMAGILIGTIPEDSMVVNGEIMRKSDWIALFSNRFGVDPNIIASAYAHTGLKNFRRSMKIEY